MEKTDVQVTSVVPLSEGTRQGIIARARRALVKKHLGNSLLHIYVKNANARIGCTANLFTDHGRYHAYVEDWNVRKAASSAIAALEVQLGKQVIHA